MKKERRNEIIWNIINSILAGLIAFLSSIVTMFSNQNLDLENIGKAITIAVVASLLIAVVKFKDFWDGEKREFCIKAFNLI